MNAPAFNLGVIVKDAAVGAIGMEGRISARQGDLYPIEQSPFLPITEMTINNSLGDITTLLWNVLEYGGVGKEPSPLSLNTLFPSGIAEQDIYLYSAYARDKAGNRMTPIGTPILTIIFSAMP